MHAPALMPGSMRGAGVRAREWAVVERGLGTVWKMMVWPCMCRLGLESDTARRGQELDVDGVCASDGLRTGYVCTLGGRRGGLLNTLIRGGYRLYSEEV